MKRFTLLFWIIPLVMLNLVLVTGYAAREKIAYVKQSGNGKLGLYVADATGENQRKLTDDVASDRPAWSPDGSQIAFISKEHFLYVINVADGERQLLSRWTSWHASWSPDGHKLVIMGDRLSLRIFDLKAGTETEIPGTGLGNSPAWSPDGKQITFRDSQDGNWDIRLIDIDGRNPRWLVEAPTEERYPTWSPDGSKLAFSSLDKRESQIFVMDFARNNKIRQLTALPFTAQAPIWSPDGKQIAFSGKNAQSVRGIYVVSAEGGKPELLIPGGSVPAWCCPFTRFAITPREKLTTSWGKIKEGD